MNTRSRFHRLLPALALALTLAWSATSATAASGAAFSTDFDAFYAAYRTALFATNSGDAAKAQKSIVALQQQWSQLAPYRTAPPTAYAADPQWQATLDAVDGQVREAAAAISAGNLAEGHEVLEGIRDAWSEARQRNGLISFSDHVNAYHEVMEHALVLGGEGAAALTPERLDALRDSSAVLVYLAGQLEHNAPAALQGNAEFQKLLQANQTAVADLTAALKAGNADAAAKAAVALKKPYAQLFVKFG